MHESLKRRIAASIYEFEHYESDTFSASRVNLTKPQAEAILAAFITRAMCRIDGVFLANKYA